MARQKEQGRGQEDRTPRWLRGFVVFLSGWACVAVQPGCARSVVLGARGWGQPAPRHRFVEAGVSTTVDRQVLLYLYGVIEPAGYAYDYYTFAIHRMEDDTGKQLAFRAFSMEYAKASFFDMVFEEPAKDAKTVKIDITFATRGGEERIVQELPFKRIEPGPGLERMANWPTTRPSTPRD